MLNCDTAENNDAAPLIRSEESLCEAQRDDSEKWLQFTVFVFFSINESVSQTNV